MKVRDQPIRPQTWVVAFCVLAIACAAFAVSAQSRAQTPHRVVTVSIDQRPAPIVAANDCPVDQTCAATGVRAAVVTTVLAAFPDATLTADLTHAALAGAPSGSGATVLRETVNVRTHTGVLVSVFSRCVEQGSGVRATQSPSVPAVGPATVFAVVPGRAGCSVGVILRVPAGVVVPWRAATTLAHRSLLQLPG